MNTIHTTTAVGVVLASVLAAGCRGVDQQPRCTCSPRSEVCAGDRSRLHELQVKQLVVVDELGRRRIVMGTARESMVPFVTLYGTDGVARVAIGISDDAGSEAGWIEVGARQVLEEKGHLGPILVPALLLQGGGNTGVYIYEVTENAVLQRALTADGVTGAKNERSAESR